MNGKTINADLARTDFASLACGRIKLKQDGCRTIFKVVEDRGICDDGVGVGMKLTNVPASHRFAWFNRRAEHVVYQTGVGILIALGIKRLKGKAVECFGDELFLKRCPFKGFLGEGAPSCIISRRKFGCQLKRVCHAFSRSERFRINDTRVKPHSHNRTGCPDSRPYCHIAIVSDMAVYSIWL